MSQFEFKVGQRVLCVNSEGFPGILLAGHSYKVTAVGTDMLSLQLQGQRLWFYVDRFVPVVNSEDAVATENVEVPKLSKNYVEARFQVITKMIEVGLFKCARWQLEDLLKQVPYDDKVEDRG